MCKENFSLMGKKKGSLEYVFMVGFPEEEVRWKSRIKGCRKLRSLQETSRYEVLQMKSINTKGSYPGGER